MGATMSLDEWAARWNLPAAALIELRVLLARNDHAPPLDPAAEVPGSEARQQSLVRLAAAKEGLWLTRNNVGAYKDPKTNRLVRYGLCNESKAQNEKIKSADLIGFKKKIIVAADVGKTIAQFASVECKKEGWKYTGNTHEVAQARWRDFVNLNGGYAIFASGPLSFKEQP